MADIPDNDRYEQVHKSPNGPGDGRPTALQILEDNDRIGSLQDKTILITGGTDGLGLETVRTLAKTGARVFFTARNEGKAQKVLEELKTDQDLKDAKIDWVQVDNGKMQSVKSGAEKFLKKSDRLNVLVCNAGIANTPYKLTEDGFEEQFAVDHLAHLLLFQILKPLLLKSSTPDFNSRVVMISSEAHAFSTVQLGNYDLRRPASEPYIPLVDLEDGDHRNPIILYAQAKTANIWMANEIERRYGGSGVHGLSLHPGKIITAGWANLDPRVAAKFAVYMEMEELKKDVKNVEQGAATQVLAAVGRNLEGKGGVFLDDCKVSSPIPENGAVFEKGYAKWAFDVDGQKQLWTDSLKMLELEDDK